MRRLTLDRFMELMNYEWTVESYSVDDNGKLRVNYRSCEDPAIEWSHNPFNDLVTTPRIGVVGRIGFVPNEQ